LHDEEVGIMEKTQDPMTTNVDVSNLSMMVLEELIDTARNSLWYDEGPNRCPTPEDFVESMISYAAGPNDSPVSRDFAFTAEQSAVLYTAIAQVNDRYADNIPEWTEFLDYVEHSYTRQAQCFLHEKQYDWDHFWKYINDQCNAAVKILE